MQSWEFFRILGTLSPEFPKNHISSREFQKKKKVKFRQDPKSFKFWFLGLSEVLNDLFYTNIKKLEKSQKMDFFETFLLSKFGKKKLKKNERHWTKPICAKGKAAYSKLPEPEYIQSIKELYNLARCQNTYCGNLQINSIESRTQANVIDARNRSQVIQMSCIPSQPRTMKQRNNWAAILSRYNVGWQIWEQFYAKQPYHLLAQHNSGACNRKLIKGRNTRQEKRPTYRQHRQQLHFACSSKTPSRNSAW